MSLLKLWPNWKGNKNLNKKTTTSYWFRDLDRNSTLSLKLVNGCWRTNYFPGGRRNMSCMPLCSIEIISSDCEYDSKSAVKTLIVLTPTSAPKFVIIGNCRVQCTHIFTEANLVACGLAKHDLTLNPGLRCFDNWYSSSLYLQFFLDCY